MKYEHIFPIGILVHDVPTKIANETEEFVVNNLHKIPRPDNNAPHATDYFEKDKAVHLSLIHI